MEAQPVDFRKFVEALGPADRSLFYSQLAPAIFESIFNKPVPEAPAETPAEEAPPAIAETAVEPPPPAEAEIEAAQPKVEVAAQPEGTPVPVVEQAAAEPDEQPAPVPTAPAAGEPAADEVITPVSKEKFDQTIGAIAARRKKRAARLAPAEEAAAVAPTVETIQAVYDTQTIPLDSTQLTRLGNYITRLTNDVNYEKTLVTSASASRVDTRAANEETYKDNPEMLKALKKAGQETESQSIEFTSSALHRLLFAYRIKTLLAPSARDPQITAGQDLVNQILDHMNDSDRLLYKEELDAVVLALKLLSKFDIETIGKKDSKQSQQTFSKIKRMIYPEPTYNYTHPSKSFSWQDEKPFFQLANIGAELSATGINENSQIALDDIEAYDKLSYWVLSLQDSTSEPVTPAVETPAVEVLPPVADTAAAPAAEAPATAAETPAAIPEIKAQPATRTVQQIKEEAQKSFKNRGNWYSSFNPDESGMLIKNLMSSLGLTAEEVSIGDAFSTDTDNYSVITANGITDTTQTEPISLETVKIRIASPKVSVGVIRVDEVFTESDIPPAGFDGIKDKINNQIGGDKIIHGLEQASARLLDIDPEKYRFQFSLFIKSQTDIPADLPDLKVYISKKK